jgi:predicted HTH domain antitoxin
MNALHIEFDLPRLLATQAGFNSENATTEVRRMLALFLYEHQSMSLGKALEMAETSYWEFAELNRQLGIPIRYSQQDLEEDLDRLAHV